MKYKIEITKVYVIEEFVEADSKEDAREMAHDFRYDTPRENQLIETATTVTKHD